MKKFLEEQENKNKMFYQQVQHSQLQQQNYISHVINQNGIPIKQ